MLDFIKLSALTATLGLSVQMVEAQVLPVCERTPAVKVFLEGAIGKGCESITPEDLLTVKRVAVGHKNIEKFNVDDFSGLTQLEILNIRSNPFTELPEGLMKDLVNLKTLVIIDTPLRHYPDDYLLHNPKLTNIHVFRNNVHSISESVFKRLEALSDLKIVDVDTNLQADEMSRLNALFPAGGTVELIVN